MPNFNFSSGNPANLVGNSNAAMSDIQGSFTDLRTFLNGQLDTANLTAGAAIKEAQLATGSNGLATGCFSAYRNAALSLGTGSFVAFDSEEFDVSGWFDTAGAAGRYTPLIAGYYRLSWMVSSGTAMTADNFWQANLHKNATLLKNGQPMNYRSAALGVWSSGSAVVQANGTTDFFDVRIAFNNGGTAAIATGAASTFFQGELIGRS